MGVGGNFWELLRPSVRREGPDRFRGLRVAVDLPFWVVQSATGVGGRARRPHIRNVFFRTIALFAKMGVLPVFVIDGEPSPLKTRARIERFYRGSGVNSDALLNADDAAATPVMGRNHVFSTYIEECVEMLELLGMPVLHSKCEAEALCALLNNQGHVDACITADSDAFLYGARCVIKSFRPNCREPFECYYASDIEADLRLKRKQMLAIALLVGTDHDLNGVTGFGIETALRFVQMFTEKEVLDRLREVSKGIIPEMDQHIKLNDDKLLSSSWESSPNSRQPHCSTCGHPGTKKVHASIPCDYCLANGSHGCIEKPGGFKCMCPTCKKTREDKECKRYENWLLNICSRIAAQKNFPNEEIISMYLSDSYGDYVGNVCPSFCWDEPNLEALVDFLTYKQHWEPSYVRQRMLPMLTTIYLRKMAEDPLHCSLLCDQYEFHSIHRVKIRFGFPCYVVKWKRVGCRHASTVIPIEPKNGEEDDDELASGPSDPSEDADEPDIPQVLADEQCWYLLTDENMDLMQAAFPKEVERFQQEKKNKEQRPKASPAGKSKAETSTPSSIQLSIMEFYRSTKVNGDADKKPLLSSGSTARYATDEGRRRPPELEKKLTKSARRRLLFD